jgi:hypothetical protein
MMICNYIFYLGITNLYKALLSAEEINGQIQLNSNLYFPVEPHDTLIVRKAGRHIFRLFDYLILKGGNLGGGDRFRRMVVVGPEGIGKVRFLLFD